MKTTKEKKIKGLNVKGLTKEELSEIKGGYYATYYFVDELGGYWYLIDTETGEETIVEDYFIA